MLWKIDGFFSGDDNPPEPPMPGYGRPTRSAFGDGFQRLLTFDMTSVEPFYMRFGLFKEHGYRPILVMGNIKARFSFWDLQRFEGRRSTGKDPASVAKNKQQFKDLLDRINKKRNSKKTTVGQVLTINTRVSSVTASDTSDKDFTAIVKNNKRKRDLVERVLINNTTRASSAASDLTRTSNRMSKQHGGMCFNQIDASEQALIRSTVSLIPRSSLAISGPTSAPVMKPALTPDTSSTSRPTPETADPKPEIPPRSMRNYIRHAAHKTTVVNCPIDFACRAIDWSLDGKWCVGVGDRGMIAIFGRWLDK